MTTNLQPVNGATAEPITNRAVARRLRTVAAARMEEALGELPAIARRVRTLLLFVCISIPVFLFALLAILWHLAS